jgi:hypothetical protein
MKICPNVVSGKKFIKNIFRPKRRFMKSILGSRNIRVLRRLVQNFLDPLPNLEILCYTKPYSKLNFKFRGNFSFVLSRCATLSDFSTLPLIVSGQLNSALGLDWRQLSLHQPTTIKYVQYFSRQWRRSKIQTKCYVSTKLYKLIFTLRKWYFYIFISCSIVKSILKSTCCDEIVSKIFLSTPRKNYVCAMWF